MGTLVKTSILFRLRRRLAANFGGSSVQSQASAGFAGARLAAVCPLPFRHRQPPAGTPPPPPPQTDGNVGFAGSLADPVAALILCTPGHVDMSVVNGSVVVKDGKLTTCDLEVLGGGGGGQLPRQVPAAWCATWQPSSQPL